MEVLRIILFALFHYCCADKDRVPVIVIDDEDVTSHWNVQADPLKKVSASYFSDIVAESSRRSNCVIIFIEEKLSTEDISLKDALGTPYNNLRKRLHENKAKYLPSVSQPYRILTRLFPPQQANIFYLDTADNFELPDKNLKYFFVSFQNPFNATRIENLRNHDTIVKEVIEKVRYVKTGPVIGIYTGKKNPINIEKIEFAVKFQGNDKEGKTVRSKKAMFRLSGIYSASQLRRVRFNQMPEVVAENWTNNSYSIKMTYTDFELRFFFKFTNNEWILTHVTLIESDQVVGSRRMNVAVPWGWSYVCSSPLVVLNTRDGSTVTISKYQIQPFQEGGPNSNSTFGKCVHCEPYFSSHILAGLFVSTILLIILGGGITCMMDCQSNNRFDDPNGKEILSKADIAQG